jgi:hypothetical protein
MITTRYFFDIIDFNKSNLVAAFSELFPAELSAAVPRDALFESDELVKVPGC